MMLYRKNFKKFVSFIFFVSCYLLFSSTPKEHSSSNKLENFLNNIQKESLDSSNSSFQPFLENKIKQLENDEENRQKKIDHLNEIIDNINHASFKNTTASKQNAPSTPNFLQSFQSKKKSPSSSNSTFKNFETTLNRDIEKTLDDKDHYIDECKKRVASLKTNLRKQTKKLQKQDKNIADLLEQIKEHITTNKSLNSKIQKNISFISSFLNSHKSSSQFAEYYKSKLNTTKEKIAYNEKRFNNSWQNITNVEEFVKLNFYTKHNVPFNHENAIVQNVPPNNKFTLRKDKPNLARSRTTILAQAQNQPPPPQPPPQKTFFGAPLEKKHRDKTKHKMFTKHNLQLSDIRLGIIFLRVFQQNDDYAISFAPKLRNSTKDLKHTLQPALYLNVEKQCLYDKKVAYTFGSTLTIYHCHDSASTGNANPASSDLLPTNTSFLNQPTSSADTIIADYRQKLFLLDFYLVKEFAFTAPRMGVQFVEIQKKLFEEMAKNTMVGSQLINTNNLSTRTRGMLFTYGSEYQKEFSCIVTKIKATMSLACGIAHTDSKASILSTTKSKNFSKNTSSSVSIGESHPISSIALSISTSIECNPGFEIGYCMQAINSLPNFFSVKQKTLSYRSDHPQNCICYQGFFIKVGCTF